MKMKGINGLEQHADKIALGIVAAAGLAAVALQFVGGGKGIKVGSQDNVPLATAFGPVADAANRLQISVNADRESVKTPEAPAFTLSDKLAIGAKAPKAGGARVALGPSPQIKQGDTGAVIAAAAYALPSVPAPSGAVAVPYSAAIHPAETILHPDLAALLPAAQPFDKAAVSVEFTFDGTALRAAFEADPEGPAEAVPLAWWRGTEGSGADLVTIVGVEVERELIAAPDGVTPSGPATTMLAPLPGRVNGIDQWTKNVRSIGDVPVMVDALRMAAEEVERPMFYSTIEGPKWEPPTEFLAKGDPAERRKQVDMLRRQERTIRGRIAVLEEQLAAAPAATQPGTREGRTPPPPAPGGKGGPGAGPGVPPPSTTSRPAGGDRRTIERNLSRARTELAGVTAKLAALGEAVEGAAGTEAAAEVGAAPAAPLFENPSVTLWAHDLTGLPGGTYRYRARVVVNNPLFDRNLQDGPQKELGKESLIRGAWSEWSAPVTVDPMHAFFVTSAAQRGGVSSRPTASAEVYQFYYGYYRLARVSLEPGDIVADDAKLPELRTADLAKLGEALKKGNPGQMAPVVPDRAPPPGRGTPGRGTPGPGAQPPVQPAVPGAGTPSGSEGEATIQWPEWMTQEVGKNMPLRVDAIFLDVLDVPSESGGMRSQAILRLGNGDLAIKAPDAESKTALYRRLEGSARIGQTQGREVRRPEEDRLPFNPVRPGQRDRQPGQSGGGGGGGGG